MAGRRAKIIKGMKRSFESPKEEDKKDYKKALADTAEEAKESLNEFLDFGGSLSEKVGKGLKKKKNKYGN